jgi:hypothetical protein
VTPQQRRREATWRRRGVLWQGQPFTWAHYEELLDEQQGACFGCGRFDADSRGRALHVDHDHKTGEARGALCSFCNTLLGIKGLAPRIERLALYHQDPPARRRQRRAKKVGRAE